MWSRRLQSARGCKVRHPAARDAARARPRLSHPSLLLTLRTSRPLSEPNDRSQLVIPCVKCARVRKVARPGSQARSQQPHPLALSVWRPLPWSSDRSQVVTAPTKRAEANKAVRLAVATSCSRGGEAAVDVDCLAGDVVARGRGEEHRHAREVGRLPVPADHRPCRQGGGANGVG